MNQDFIVNRADLSDARLQAANALQAGAGEVVLKVERFALTANNITYGVAGDMIGYWQFFPAEAGWGRIPVWGIGVVTASEHPDLNPGDRFYGYFPMSNELKVKPEKVSNRGFTDASSHRSGLPAVYNQYAAMTPENGFDPRFDNHMMIYRPLFTTSFVIEDFLSDNNCFGGDAVVIGSASSKTGFGLAYMLKQGETGVRVIGLTSEANLSFVEGLGLYDEVRTYDAVADLDASVPTVYVDMSGNRRVLSQVHHHYGDNLVYSCGVGITHWSERDGETPGSLPGPTPAMFFAPSQIQKRNEEWGAQQYQAKIGEATAGFLARVDNWVKIEEHPFAGIDSVYTLVLQGAAPDRGIVVVF
ncbi:MAG: DUF2855 family protein [Pseudomonadota bacterium]